MPNSIVEIDQDRQSLNLISLANNSAPITVNISNFSVQQEAKVQSIIANELNGDIIFTLEDNHLVELFNSYANKIEALTLQTLLSQVKDSSAPEAERKLSAQKIKEFLYKISGPIGESALKILVAYLEKQLIGL